MTARSVPEWIGATPDAPIPRRVRLRVFERAGGICHISGRKIRPGDKWEIDHVIALVNGGENRESNLAPALADAHRAKTREDVAQKAKDRRVKAKHLGQWESRQKLPGSRVGKWKRKVSGETVLRESEP